MENKSKRNASISRIDKVFNTIKYAYADDWDKKRFSVERASKDIRYACAMWEHIRNPDSTGHKRTYKPKNEYDAKSEKREIATQWLRYCYKAGFSAKTLFQMNTLGFNDPDELMEDVIRRYDIFFDPEDQKMYSPLIIRWYLRRYNLSAAWRLRQNLMDKINCLFPRMLSCILVGYTLLLTTDSLFHFVNSFKHFGIILVFLFGLLASWGLLALKTYDLTGNIKIWKRRFLKRTIIILAIGLIYALFISWIVFLFLKFFSNISLDNCAVLYLYPAIYAPLALFLGLIIQNLWEDKTITEPF